MWKGSIWGINSMTDDFTSWLRTPEEPALETNRLEEVEVGGTLYHDDEPWSELDGLLRVPYEEDKEVWEVGDRLRAAAHMRARLLERCGVGEPESAREGISSSWRFRFNGDPDVLLRVPWFGFTCNPF